MHKNIFVILASLMLLMSACIEEPDGPTPTAKDSITVEINVPPFNKDSAYAFVQKQVDFGPRVPETSGHQACANWLKQKLTDYGWQTQFQQAEIDGYKRGERMNITNIIASYKPELKNRVLLCAHWDTRYHADQDTARIDEPILGADDGGSGVGVLLEIARVIGENDLNLGVEIVFFDAEDQGESDSPRPSEQTWCLGSQYWSKNLHEMAAKPRFGILLDMVGYTNARFPMEGVSTKRAPAIHNAVWQEAHELGYTDLFLREKIGDLVDDHVFINDIAHIPTIDIINIPTNPAANGTFGYYWHTHKDNMDVIGKHTLNAVGRTLLNVLYKEEKGLL